jgi:hypothetical protein
MGAITSLLHSHRDSSIAGMILDSPLSDLRMLSMELANKYSKAPMVFKKILISLIKGSIKSRAKFNIDDISPIKFVSKSFIPCYFLYGTHDDFIHPHHSIDLYKIYAGEKNIFSCDGDHFTERPKSVLDPLCIFLYNILLGEKLPQQASPIKHPELLDLDIALQIGKISTSMEDDQTKKILIDSLLKK